MLKQLFSAPKSIKYKHAQIIMYSTLLYKFPVWYLECDTNQIVFRKKKLYHTCDDISKILRKQNDLYHTVQRSWSSSCLYSSAHVTNQNGEVVKQAFATVCKLKKTNIGSFCELFKLDIWGPVPKNGSLSSVVSSGYPGSYFLLDSGRCALGKIFFPSDFADDHSLEIEK